MKNNPTLRDISTSFDLWQEYADPSGIWDENRFNAVSVSEKIKTLLACGFTDETEVDE